jgi:hypothetical protein
MVNSAESDRKDRIAEIKAQLADLRARLPAHSFSPRMMIELDELESELERLEGSCHRQPLRTQPPASE